MSARVLALLGLMVVLAAGWWWWRARCERACARMDQQSHELFERGELVAALRLIDSVDARCNCGRFTSGDAPPQYALARTCLERLRLTGRQAELDDLLAKARGPILSELSKHRE